MGNFIISPTDLETLRSRVGKDKNLLRDCDLNLYDKINYDAVRRISRESIEQLLKIHVPGTFFIVHD
jgi:hypothetical protein